jgi:hypothetical protein
MVVISAESFLTDGRKVPCRQPKCDAAALSALPDTDPSARTPSPEPAERTLIIGPLIPYVTRKTAKDPQPPIVFPLSPDHYLITLAQVTAQARHAHYTHEVVQN